MAETDVIHLVWRGAGFESFRTFLASYAQYPAGEDHELVILFNGFRTEELELHRALLEKSKHRELITPRPMLDIAAYFWAAEQCTGRFVGFLNSYSTLLADNWLRRLVDQVRLPRVGAAGATGTWESVYTAYAKRIERLGGPRSPADWPRHLYRLLRLRRYRAQFNPMPNPHLRSNAFLIERERWLQLHRPPLVTKAQTLQFENGKQSMSGQLLSAGLQLYVVDRDGNAYAPEEWPRSQTYRRGKQEKLLVADNRTRQYEEADEIGKRYLEEISWGEAV
jgi:hypothetical protein